MPLGMEVGLGPSNIVLDGDPAPRHGGTASNPIFGPCLLNCGQTLGVGWIKILYTW